MKFLMTWHPTQNAASLAPPSPELMTAMDQLMGEMATSSRLVMAGAIGSPATGGRLHLADRQVAFTDGPFSEAKEMVGGFCIVETQSREEAIELARRFVDLHIPYGYEGVSEVRQLLGPEDYVAE